MTPSGIIALWPSAEHFAADIGLKYPSYGRVMKMRGRIPKPHWPVVAAAAAKRRLPVTLSDIEAAHTPPAPSPTPEKTEEKAA